MCPLFAAAQDNCDLVCCAVACCALLTACPWPSNTHHCVCACCSPSPSPPSGGDASLQNGLELCQELMLGVPPYGHKEVLMLMAALSIVDPGRVEDSIQACKAAHIRCARRRGGGGA
jgi:hypothetical protein